MDDASIDATIDEGFDAEDPGVVLHPLESPCSPKGWCWTNPLPFGDGVRDIYRAPSGTVWILGYVSLHRRIGSTWTTYWFDDPPAAMAGAGESLFLVGNSIVVFDGSEFRSKPDPVSGKRLHAVAARTETDAWAVGEQGAIAHFDGTAWHAIDAKSTDPLTSIAIVSESELWVGSNAHGPLHFVSGAWSADLTRKATPEVATDGTRVWSGTTDATYLLDGGSWTKISDRAGRLHARGPDDLLLCTTTLERFHEGKHDVLRTAPPGFYFRAVDARVLDDAWIGSDEFGVSLELLHGPLDRLVAETKAATLASLSSVFGRSPDELYAVGHDTLVAFDGKEWKPIAIPAGAWVDGTVSPDGRLFVAEEELTSVPARVLRRVGDTFIDLAYPRFIPSDLWSPDGETLYVAGDDTQRWNGVWSKVPSAGVGAIGVDGTGPHDLWFVSGDAVFHGDPTGLVRKMFPGRWSVVAAHSPTDVWISGSATKVSGEFGSVGHFDRSKWSSFPVDKGLRDIDADSTGLWAVTDSTVLHGRGPTLDRHPLVIGLHSIHARQDGDQHVVGVGGVALRRSLP